MASAYVWLYTVLYHRNLPDNGVQDLIFSLFRSVYEA